MWNDTMAALITTFLAIFALDLNAQDTDTWIPGEHYVNQDYLQKLDAKRNIMGQKKFTDYLTYEIRNVSKAKRRSDILKIAARWKKEWPISDPPEGEFDDDQRPHDVARVINAMVVTLAKQGNSSNAPILEEYRAALTPTYINNISTAFSDGLAAWAYVELMTKGMPPEKKIEESFRMLTEKKWWLGFPDDYFFHFLKNHRGHYLTELRRAKGYSNYAASVLASDMARTGIMTEQDASKLASKGDVLAKVVAVRILCTQKSMKAFPIIRDLLKNANEDTAKEMRSGLFYPLGFWGAGPVEGRKEAINLIKDWYRDETRDDLKRREKAYLERAGIKFDDAGNITE